MCHAPLLVRGSNKEQQDSPVLTGKARPALPKGQVPLNPSRQSVSEEPHFRGAARATVSRGTSRSFLRSSDETCTRARLFTRSRVFFSKSDADSNYRT